MLCSDAKQKAESRFASNLNDIITIDIIAEIQKDLTTYDLTSLVFLLYDAPETALQRLTLLQRVARDVQRKDLNLLYDWALHKQKVPTWRQEFLEALVTLQLFGVIRKLGFDVVAHRKANPLNMDYLNPMKVALYELCEKLTMDNFTKLRKALGTYNMNIKEYDSCEMILLHLMCQKFIAVGEKECSVLKLTEIIENIPDLKPLAKQLSDTELILNKERSGFFQVPATSTYQSTPKVKPLHGYHESKTKVMESVIETFDGNFEDTFEILADLLKENLTITDLKTDAAKLSAESCYEIKNPQRIGVCCIINQENFYPSYESISNKTCTEPLSDRTGSVRDKGALIYTMKTLNFHVEATDNVKHQDILPYIKNIIENKVKADDSMFFLCILSHGIEGHVYGVDSVPVKINDIQDLLDSKDAHVLRGKPKILIIQACQVTSDKPALTLVADGPRKLLEESRMPSYFLRKADFLICWATAPEYEAWRDENKGSVFIQMLCSILYKRAKHEHMLDMITKVTDTVAEICAQKGYAQIPEFKARLRKKLYLCVPKIN